MHFERKLKKCWLLSLSEHFSRLTLFSFVHFVSVFQKISYKRKHTLSIMARVYYWSKLLMAEMIFIRTETGTKKIIVCKWSFVTLYVHSKFIWIDVSIDNRILCRYEQMQLLVLIACCTFGHWFLICNINVAIQIPVSYAILNSCIVVM